MAGSERWKYITKRWIRALIPPLLIVVVLVIYVIFLNYVTGRMTTDMDAFNDFVIYADSVKDDIAAVAEAELSAHKDDTQETTEIPKEGDPARSRLFQTAFSGETYISDTTGSRCAKFVYLWYGMECVIVYDSGSAKLHEDGTDYSGAITDSIIAAKSDSIKY